MKIMIINYPGVTAMLMVSLLSLFSCGKKDSGQPAPEKTSGQLAWQKALGGTGTEYAQAVAPTPDGGYLMAGYTTSSDGDVTTNHGNDDYWVVKLNADQSIAWQKTFGGTNDDRANSIVALADGGCVIAGLTYSNDGDVTVNKGGVDYWVIKLNASGAIVWQKTYGGSGDDLATSIVATSDGYAVAGYTSSTNGDVTGNHGSYDYWVVKLNTNGTIAGRYAFGGTSADYGYSITATSDGGYLVAGRSASSDGDVTSPHGNADCWVVKMNASGAIVWQKALGGSGNDIGQSVVATVDGGYLVGATVSSNDGDVTSNHGAQDFWVVKLNAGGAIVWQKALGGTLNDNLYALAPATDGGCAVAGYTSSANGDVTGNHGSIDTWVVRLNAGGAMIWQKALGGTLKDMGYSTMVASNNGFIVAGASNSVDGDVTGGHGGYDCWIYKVLD
jgi:hypothetical protein